MMLNRFDILQIRAKLERSDIVICLKGKMLMQHPISNV